MGSHSIFDALFLTLFSSDVESLKKGIIKSSTNKGKTPYTILLVGETGVGKSSVVELIANALVAHGSDHYDFSILDHNNESQINSVRLYEFKSKNDVVVSVRFYLTWWIGVTSSQGSHPRHAWIGRRS